MSKQRGLGRGLGAFFPNAAGATAQPKPVADERRVAMLDVESIVANPHQPRRDFDGTELESLSQSIRSNGVLTPILVRASGAERYEIIAGERRWRATKLAGLREIPALVREADDPQTLELALLENLQREDLNPIEEASGYRQLLDEYGFTQDALCTRLGKARPTLTNALRLLALPDVVQAMVRDGRLSAGHARALAALPAPRAEAIARTAVGQGLSVREVERLAAAASPASAKKKAPSGVATRTGQQALSPELAAVETRLRFALATRVALRPRAGGGTIEIDYVGDDDLTRIVDVMCPQDI
ncbi:MAG TPA: ParB/RepB/Spo0J family partition protein [Candidatus Eremiobacteraceae bacterium]|nr:ParB/RepB/Spo0J family partition protein [Candidatus Eremiobacteraceae bacterium]